MHRKTFVSIVAAAGALLAAAPAHAANSTATYRTGEYRIVVPAGVNTLPIVAVGGRGGNGYAGTSVGGFGDRIAWNMPVTPGAVYWLEVGGNGAGYIPGGDGAGAGGGATDIRTQPRAQA